MNPLAFFRGEAVRNALVRAAQCAGVPLSLHFVERGSEGPRMLGWGACEACRAVAAHPGGPARCRHDRAAGAREALRQGGAFPFFCHMGFACLAAPALPGQGFVLTFGPYCPAEEPRSLEYEARRGWEALARQSVETLPFTLNDIHRTPAACVPAIAQWTLEALSDLWNAALEPEDLQQGSETPETPESGAKTAKRRPSLFKGSTESGIALALLDGNSALARTLFRGALAEIPAGKRTPMGLRRVHAIHLAAAVLEAVERAGKDSSPGWRCLGVMAEEIAEASQDKALLDAVWRVFARINSPPAQRPAQGKKPETAARMRPAETPELTRVIMERLGESVRLEDVAAQLGESPTALSHRMRRKHGMSFSEYVNRLRMDRAKELLRRTRLSVTEIAQRVGVADQSNFGKLFKRFEIMTPLEYRAQFGRKR